MNDEEVYAISQWFKQTVERYSSKDPIIQSHLQLKEDHTYLVSENSINIGKQLGLTDNELRCAKTIALLHDVGRFKQFSIYKTFNDHTSENHAQISVDIIKNDHILSRLPVTEQDIIYQSIINHNVLTLPSTLYDDHLFFARLIRDADKVSIFHEVSHYLNNRTQVTTDYLEHNLPNDDTYSTTIITDLLNNTNVNTYDIKTFNDVKLCILAYIFDINFIPTFRLLQKNDYLTHIIRHLPQDTTIQKVTTHLQNYLHEKLQGKMTERRST